MDYKFLILLIIYKSVLSNRQVNFLGCSQNIESANVMPFNVSYTSKECVEMCYENYFRYALIRNENICVCDNFIGDLKNLNNCSVFCPSCELKNQISNTYFTGLTVSGPPKNLKISNVTDTQIHVSWDPPDYRKNITNYKITAKYIESYAQTKVSSPEWEFSNNTYRNEINNLHPGSLYNITVQAVSTDYVGIPAFKTIRTQIGEPDRPPLQPKILSRNGTTMKVKLQPVQNDNGPVTSYLIIIVNTDLLQTVEIKNLKSVRQAKFEGLTYYITAEIEPEKINEEFTVGDGKTYGKYHNAPLDPTSTYDVMLAINSTADRISKYLLNERNIVLDVPYNDDGIITALSIAIGIVTFLLIVGLIAFFVLRYHINNRFRQRLQDVQELTLQGPMIDIENNGYISEESPRINHYKNLTSQIWMIPHDSLNIDETLLLAEGKFGNVFKGTVTKDSLLNVSVYSIADRHLNHQDKHSMLKEMDLLIKTENHPNILQFIGACENLDTINIVLEYAMLSLKEFLIGSRIPSTDKFTTITEPQVFNFAVDIAKGMAHLHSKKILHKKLCARHVIVVDGSVKISGYGLTEFYKDAKSPNCIRWTAKEIFKGRAHTYKSDVWSYACLLWEICALGGTPYGNILNVNIPQEVIRGLLLPQLPYLSDNLYQILLNCWQLDLDERPSFNCLIDDLNNLKDEQLSSLSFHFYNGFEYEQVYVEQELNKSVFQ